MFFPLPNSFLCHKLYSRAAQKVDRDLPVDRKGFAGRSHDIPLKIYNQNYKGKYLLTEITEPLILASVT